MLHKMVELRRNMLGLFHIKYYILKRLIARFINFGVMWKTI
jgi:hypothetical protein